jgi:glyoxylase-like metal-dependent hydrolase (beta-lactamase superfamily II)
VGQRTRYGRPMSAAPTRWQIGDVTITKIQEVELHWPFTALLPDFTPELIDASPWMRPHFVDEKGKLILSIHGLVVESQGRRILVDTCIGNDKPRPTRPFNELHTTFLDDLTAAGFAPDSIDTVCCTHLHVDHVGWNTQLVDGRWVPTFTNARHLFGKVEYEFWLENEEVAVMGPYMSDSVIPIMDAGLADLVDPDHRLTDEVWFESTPGHTPGHYSVHISSGGVDAVITGDMTHSPLQFAHPHLSCSADTDAKQADQTRQDFVKRYGDTPTLIIGTHFAGPTAGRIVRDGDTWRFDV